MKTAGLRGSRSHAIASSIAALALIMTLAGCASKTAQSSAPPAAPPPSSSAPLPPPPANVSEPQTRVSLPPAQPIPDGAAPEPAPPLPPLPDRQPAPAPTRQSVRVRPTPSRPTPPPVEPERDPARQAPILSAMLSESEKREYNRIISDNVVQTKRNLELLSGRTLNEDQRAAVKRIRAFLRQTDEAQQDDLALARSLSERARLLAEDLVRNSL